MGWDKKYLYHSAVEFCSEGVDSFSLTAQLVVVQAVIPIIAYIHLLVLIRYSFSSKNSFTWDLTCFEQSNHLMLTINGLKMCCYLLQGDVCLWKELWNDQKVFRHWKVFKTEDFVISGFSVTWHKWCFFCVIFTLRKKKKERLVKEQMFIL